MVKCIKVRNVQSKNVLKFNILNLKVLKWINLKDKCVGVKWAGVTHLSDADDNQMRSGLWGMLLNHNLFHFLFTWNTPDHRRQK